MPRPRRGAYIYRRTGRPGWWAYVDREHKDIPLGTDDETEAQRRLVELLDERGLHPVASNDRPLADVFASTLERARTENTPKTAYELGLNLDRICAWCLARQVRTAREVTREVVDDYKTARRFERQRKGPKGSKGVSAARINRELDSWRRAMAIAVSDGYAAPAVLDAFERLREPRPLPHQPGLTRAQLDAFLGAVKHPGYRALFRLALGTGMRDDELRHLDEADIQPPWIIVNPKPGWTTKGYRYRSIPASPDTVTAAREFVPNRDGRPPYLPLNLDPKAVWHVLQAARRLAKVKAHFSLHDLRRSWASHMLAAGHRIEDISRWLGHADVLTTMRYLRVIDGAPPKPETLPW